jgi:hypothetical protein
VQDIVSKERFRVSWDKFEKDFRDTDIVPPINLINLISEFTTFEKGFYEVFANLNPATCYY